MNELGVVIVGKSMKSSKSRNWSVNHEPGLGGNIQPRIVSQVAGS